MHEAFTRDKGEAATFSGQSDHTFNPGAMTQPNKRKFKGPEEETSVWGRTVNLIGAQEESPSGPQAEQRRPRVSTPALSRNVTPVRPSRKEQRYNAASPPPNLWRARTVPEQGNPRIGISVAQLLADKEGTL